MPGNPYTQDDPRWAGWEEQSVRETQGPPVTVAPGDTGQTVNVDPNAVARWQQSTTTPYLNPTEDEGRTANVPGRGERPGGGGFTPRPIQWTDPNNTKPSATEQSEAPKPPAKVDPNSVVMAGQGNGQGGGQQNRPLPGPGYIPGSPGTLVKGGRTPHSWSTTQEAGLDLGDVPERQAAADQMAQDAAAGLTDAEARKAEITNEHKQQQAQTKMLNAEQTKARQAERDAVLADAKVKYDKAADIDPEAWWNKKSAVGQILAHLAVGVGAFVAGRTGRNNQVLDQINKEIERDVQNQIGKLNKARQDIQDFYGQWDREDQKIAAGEAASYDIALAHLDDMLAGVNDQAAKARGMKLRSELEQQAVDRRVKLLDLMQGKKVVQQNDVQTADRVVGGSAGRYDWRATMQAIKANGGDLEQVQKDVDATVKATGMKRDDAMMVVASAYGVTGVPTGAPDKQTGPGSPQTFVADAYGGKGGFAPDSETARKKAEQYRAYGAIKENLTRMADLQSRTGSSFGDTNAQYQALANDVLALYAVANGQGALSEGDRATMGKILGMNANDTFSITGKAQLGEAQNIIDRRLKGLDSGLAYGTRTVQGGQVRGRVTGVAGPSVDPRTVATRKPGEK